MKKLVWFKGGSMTRVMVSVLILIAITFAGCEENMWLKSEKKLRGKIEGSWTRLQVSANYSSDEIWTYRDGVIVIVTTEKKSNGTDEGYADFNKSDLDTLVLDVGNYSLDAKIDNAYLKLSGLEENIVESAKQGLNAKWTIVDIDGSVLYIAAENGSAVIQREFEKR